MYHTVTWECPWCKRRYCSVEGSSFRYLGKHKRRKCRACLARETRPQRNAAIDMLNTPT